ncbi:MAG: hypothetical protein OCU22_04375 [Canidatus Methanoxibalbensis ujae]|nr:hypothetical protein [Candidatus Methanoxibalbensis ujae]
MIPKIFKSVEEKLKGGVFMGLLDNPFGLKLVEKPPKPKSTRRNTISKTECGMGNHKKDLWE